jgi:hypothetical protein
LPQYFSVILCPRTLSEIQQENYLRIFGILNIFFIIKGCPFEIPPLKADAEEEGLLGAKLLVILLGEALHQLSKPLLTSFAWCFHVASISLKQAWFDLYQIKTPILAYQGFESCAEEEGLEPNHLPRIISIYYIL